MDRELTQQEQDIMDSKGLSFTRASTQAQTYMLLEYYVKIAELEARIKVLEDSI